MLFWHRGLGLLDVERNIPVLIDQLWQACVGIYRKTRAGLYAIGIRWGTTTALRPMSVSSSALVILGLSHHNISENPKSIQYQNAFNYFYLRSKREYTVLNFPSEMQTGLPSRQARGVGQAAPKWCLKRSERRAKRRARRSASTWRPRLLAEHVGD